MDEFEVYLVSNGSMSLFPDNKISAFTNNLSEPLHLEGDWRVALTEISVPAVVQNITETDFLAYKKKPTPMETHELDIVFDEWTVFKELYDFDPGVYASVPEILNQIEEKSGIKINYSVNSLSNILTLTFNALEGVSFRTNQIPNILGFEGTKDNFDGTYSGTHLGLYNASSPAMETRSFTASYPTDITAGTHLVFFLLEHYRVSTCG